MPSFLSRHPFSSSSPSSAVVENKASPAFASGSHVASNVENKMKSHKTDSAKKHDAKGSHQEDDRPQSLPTASKPRRAWHKVKKGLGKLFRKLCHASSQPGTNSTSELEVTNIAPRPVTKKRVKSVAKPSVKWNTKLATAFKEDPEIYSRPLPTVLPTRSCLKHTTGKIRINHEKLNEEVSFETFYYKHSEAFILSKKYGVDLPEGCDLEDPLPSMLI